MAAILPFLRDRENAFDPKDIMAMSMALDDVCKALNLQDDTSAREVMAVRIIDLANTGERSPTRLRDKVLREAGMANGIGLAGRRSLIEHENGQLSAGFATSRNVNAPSLRSVISTAELSKRPPRTPDYAAECRALIALGEQLAASPDRILQKLTETALTLCRAQSAGISLLEPDGKRFHWPAISGQWAEKVGGGTARDFGPCGTVLDCDAALLFSHPELDFDYFAPVTPLVEEALLMPFHVNGKAVGTVWIVMHDKSRRFDSEDLRLMTDLGAFAASAYQALSSLVTINAASAVVAFSDDAIVTKNLKSIITTWNAGAERLFGYTAAEAIGKSVTMLIPPDHEDEEPLILERIGRGERIEHYETVRVRKDGARLDISLTVSPIKDATEKIIGASKIARDITERKRNEAQILLLAREAEHRAKNILANVHAAVHLTQAENVAEFKEAVEGRIQALANVHRLFVESRWTGAELRELISEELAPYRRNDGTRISIEGPKLLLEPNTAQMMAVICHELTTNAAKYGALCGEDGRVAVTWTTSTDRGFVLRWIETGGPPVAVPTRRGFGTRVIGKMVQQAKGEIQFDWRPEGLACEVFFAKPFL
jgi:PAS domain S-box-containing protein